MKPITREEMYLAAAAGYAVTLPEPVTRKEMFLAKLAGMEVETPAVFTRQERFLDEAAVALSRSVIEPLEVTENGTYTAPDGVDGYSPVTVNVPAPEVVLQDKTITENGTYTADSGYDGLGSVEVNVKGGGGLPAGLYYEADSMPLPIKYGQRFFKHNGDLYLHAYSQKASTGNHYIYKYENQAWTKLFTFDAINDMDIGSRAIEFNGKTHFLSGGGSYSKYHAVYDDANGPTALTRTPDYITTYGCFVHDGKLKAHAHNVDKLYVWDEASDSWAEEASFGLSGEVHRIFHIYSGVVYCVCINDKKVYSYNNGSLTYLYDLSNTSAFTPIDAQVGKYVYLDNNSKLWKVNLENGIVTEVGQEIKAASGSGRARIYYVEGYGIRFHGCDYSAPNNFFNTILHEVTE